MTHYVLLMLFLFFMAVVIITLYISYQKLSGMIQTLRKEAGFNARNVVSQVEGLLAVYTEAGPTHALPKSGGWAASPDMLHVLITVIHSKRPKVVLECSSGLSTIVIASCLKRQGGGHVVSLEHSPEYASKTRELIRLHGLEDWARVVDAPLISMAIDHWTGAWYDISGLDLAMKADLLVVDGPPSDEVYLGRYPAFPALTGHLNDDAFIVLDDADRDMEKTMVTRWSELYPALREIQVGTCEKGCRLFAVGKLSGLVQRAKLANMVKNVP